MGLLYQILGHNMPSDGLPKPYLISITGSECIPCNVFRVLTSIQILYMTDMADKATAQGWVGPLLEANDKLVDALLTFENLDKSIDADSDSDDEIAAQAHMYKSMLPPLCTLILRS